MYVYPTELSPVGTTAIEMIDVPVTAVMNEPVPTVPPDTTTVEAARRLRKVDVPALVVSDGTEDVVGIVTESDVVAVVAERGGNPPVASFMSTPVVTTGPDTPVGSAGDRMAEAGVTLLPVVEEGTYLGLLTREDLAPQLSRHRLEIDWSGDRLTLDVPPGRPTSVE